MKQTRTRILSLLLALVMCLGLLPVTALADNDDGKWEFSQGVLNPDDLIDGTHTTETVTDVTDFAEGGNIPSTSADLSSPQFLVRSDEYISWYTNVVTVFTPDLPEPSRTNETPFTITLILEYPDGTSKTETIPIRVYTRTWPSNSVHDRHTRRFSTSTTKYEDFTMYQLQMPAESFAGYVFDGWYVDDVLQLDAYFPIPIPNTSSVASITYVARWRSDGSSTPNPDDTTPTPDADKSREIWFNPNGGLAIKPDNYQYIYFPRDGATIEAPSGDDGKLPVFPTAIRNGYIFDGWYTAQTGGTKVSADTDLSVYTGNGISGLVDPAVTLWAHWAEGDANVHSVTFNWNGARFSTDPIPAEHGKPLSQVYKLDYLYEDVHALKGWAMEDGTVYNGQPVTEDMTLYAIWDPELKGTDPGEDDTYQFSNDPNAFSSYTVSENYLQLLLQGETDSRQEYIRNYMKNKWGGSCFGMSAVYAMSRGGQIDLSLYQSGAERLWDLDRPIKRASVRDLINFYMLSQFTAPSQRYMGFYYNYSMSVASRYQKIVQDLQGEKDFSVLAFTFLENGATVGHAIVARSIAKGSDGNYHVSVWDPNYSTEKGELVISGSFSNAYFTDTTFDSKRYNTNTELIWIMPLSTKDQSYDARSLTGTSTISVDNPMAALSVDAGSFTLAAADGRSATVVNGKQTGGELKLLPYAIPMGANDSYHFYLDKDALNGLTVSVNGGAGQVELVSDDILARVTASGLKSVTVDEGSVSTVTSSAVQQEITLVSEELGGSWDKVVVSGKDTSISLKAKAGELTVSAANNTAVTVQRENVVKQTSGDKESVNATPEGVTVSMGGQSAAPGNAPTTSSFTDVSSGDYYYDAVAWAVENGVTAGTGDGTTFSPNDPCTRAQIVTFLWRAYGEQKPAATENPFTDLSPDDYYYDAVLWAVENGITSGTGDGTTFSPNAPCTRAQAVSFQWRAAGKPPVTGSSFTDVSSGDYYYDAVAWAVENGVTAGTGDGTTFSPNDFCTRAQIVTFLYREMGK